MMPIEDSIHQEWFDWITAMEPPKLDLIGESYKLAVIIYNCMIPPINAASTT